MSDKLVRVTGSLLERRTNRRGFLARATVVGTALAVSPVRYLLLPEEAMAVVKPGDCSPSSKCGKQNWTEFCCSIGDWGRNHCPSYSFIGGWWKCSNYQGLRVCRGTSHHHRYYIDCNAKTQTSCHCKCTRNKCSYWKTCCLRYQYPNCTPQMNPRTPIVCRIVRCENPGKLYRHCSTHGRVVNKTCCHEASCNCGQCGCRTCGNSRTCNN
jgi:hypothetical protein